MKKNIAITFLLFFSFIFLNSKSFAENTHPDTVKAGIYITSIHDIDFKQNQYDVNLWLWLTYKRKDFNFVDNLEIPEAKSFTRSFTNIDSSNGKIYILMKLQCLMKDNWRIGNFPFDRQQLKFSVENSQFDSHQLVFVPDSFGKHFDPQFTLKGWNIDSFKMHQEVKAYETTFGDSSLSTPHVEYSSFKVRISIGRDVGQLFWKIFLGMYVAFFIAYLCFYIHADNIDSRFGLSVGALFAAIGNKYIIDSSLPDSTTLTLVDILHSITLVFIFSVAACSAFALRLVKKNRIDLANKFDFITAQVLLITYLVLNCYFIFFAVQNK